MYEQLGNVKGNVIEYGKLWPFKIAHEGDKEAYV